MQETHQIIPFVLLQCYYSMNTKNRCCWLCLEQLRGLHKHESLFILSKEVGFCGNLGKESTETGAPWTCLCRPACLADLLMISQSVRTQLVDRRWRKSSQLPLVLLWCGGGGTISPGLNGMSEPDKLQTVGRTGLGQHGHTKDSTLFG